MKIFMAENALSLKERENIVFPYFEEAQIYEYLQKEPTLKREKLELLHISKTEKTLQESARIVFMKFGKSLKHSCQISLYCLEKLKMSDEFIELMMQAIVEGSYSFAKHELKQLQDITVFDAREILTDEKNNITLTLITYHNKAEAIHRGYMTGHCINHARTLGNIPNNFLHVKEFAAYATSMAKDNHLKIDILGDERLKALSCGGILAVNQGSEEEANLITITYEGAQDEPFYALIGKGVMFDAGGYHIKNMSGMEGMKYDMCGAANMLAVVELLAKRKARVNVLLVIPVVENVISPGACKMGDVITTMSGKTVEIYNTDAEGRLILCDAISYAVNEGVKEILDLATLTYSCQEALGSYISGIFSNNDQVYNRFLESVHRVGEKVWRLPLDPIYHKPIQESQTADLVNYVPGYRAGANIAAGFLEEFIPAHIGWIHLDIVGTSVKRQNSEYVEIGATGVLTAAIADYMERRGERSYESNGTTSKCN